MALRSRHAQGRGYIYAYRAVQKARADADAVARLYHQPLRVRHIGLRPHDIEVRHGLQTVTQISVFESIQRVLQVFRGYAHQALRPQHIVKRAFHIVDDLIAGAIDVQARRHFLKLGLTGGRAERARNVERQRDGDIPAGLNGVRKIVRPDRNA